MNLGQLIKCLESLPQDAVMRWGLSKADSWRGIYSQLAFEPAANITVAESISVAKSAVNQMFYGYKGGEYVMNLKTEVHWDSWGRYRENEITEAYLTSPYNLKESGMNDFEATLEERFAWIHEEGVNPDKHMCYTDITDLVKYVNKLLGPDVLIGRIDRSTSIDISLPFNRETEMLFVSDDKKEVQCYSGSEYGWLSLEGDSPNIIYHPVTFNLKQPTVTFKGVEITKAEFEELRKEFE